MKYDDPFKNINKCLFFTYDLFKQQSKMFNLEGVEFICHIFTSRAQFCVVVSTASLGSYDIFIDVGAEDNIFQTCLSKL